MITIIKYILLFILIIAFTVIAPNYIDDITLTTLNYSITIGPAIIIGLIIALTLLAKIVLYLLSLFKSIIMNPLRGARSIITHYKQSKEQNNIENLTASILLQDSVSARKYSQKICNEKDNLSLLLSAYLSSEDKTKTTQTYRLINKISPSSMSSPVSRLQDVILNKSKSVHSVNAANLLANIKNNTKELSPLELETVLEIAQKQNDFETIIKIAGMTGNNYLKNTTLLKQAHALQAEAKYKQATSAVKQIFKTHRTNTEALELLLLLLLKQNKLNQFYPIFLRSWKASPTEKLGDLFLQAIGNETDAQALKRIRKLQKNNSGNIPTLIVIIKFALAKQLWGLAKKNLDTLEKLAIPSDNEQQKQILYFKIIIATLEENKQSIIDGYKIKLAKITLNSDIKQLPLKINRSI